MAHRSAKRAICILAAGIVVGCEAPSTHQPPVVAAPSPPPATASLPSPAQKPPPPSDTAHAHEPAEPHDAEDDPDLSDVGAVGLDEGRVRELLGAPVAEEDDTVVKRLHYREGSCSIEFSMYPDVETREFRILTLMVISDDRTARGKRICVARLKSQLAVK
jgi:hypothetical protein